MRKAILFALSILALAPATAAAVTLHVHKQVPIHPVVGHEPSGPLRGTEMKTITRVVRIAPTDVDQDGLADVDDACPNTASSVNGGCPPPSPPEPPAPAPVPATPTADQAYSVPMGSSSGYSIPSYIVQCESGGSYTARNASGAYGAYQIMPSTASSYGCDLSTASGQDQCAAEIYADVGSSAWSCG